MKLYRKLYKTYLDDLSLRDQICFSLEMAYTEKFKPYVEPAWISADAKPLPHFIEGYKQLWSHQAECWRRTKKYKRLKSAKLGIIRKGVPVHV
jgi:hypothetical protein